MADSELISGGADGSLRRWRDGKPLGNPIATGQDAVSNLIQLMNGELISGGYLGSLRRWRDGKAVAGGQPIQTGPGVVMSLIELKNGELISLGAKGTLRGWLNGKPVGDGKPIATGQGAGITLIERQSGELISGGHDGSLLSLRLIPPWRELLPQACRRLEHHPRLQQWPWLNMARATYHHFVWRYRTVPPIKAGGFGKDSTF